MSQSHQCESLFKSLYAARAKNGKFGISCPFDISHCSLAPKKIVAEIVAIEVALLHTDSHNE